MATRLYTHAASKGHATPAGHPEQIARIEVIEAALSDPAFDGLDRQEAPRASDEMLTYVHPQRYVDRVTAAAPEAGLVSLDGDTHMSPGTLEAAYRAAGAACAAVDAVLGGDVQNAFCAMRPPGHHAERETAMGFCLFGSVAIAASHARRVHNLSRVAIIDFDVHHGNGTQDLVKGDDGILFVSSHQMPLYPGTGYSSETGPHNTIVNVALPAGSGGSDMRAIYEKAVFPRVDAFGPDLILVSAGFDAHADDPLANLMWVEEDFAWLTREICALAARHCSGRVVSCLEGGYSLPALGASVAAHVGVLMEESR